MYEIMPKHSGFVKNVAYLIMFIIGFGLIINSCNWQTGLGIFLVIWANNFDTIRKFNNHANT